MSKPEVSVIIPTYNRRKILLRALASLPRDVEIVVVDDGSKDGSADLARSYEHPHLIVLSQKNAGPGIARNTGIAAASGRIIAFMDDDCVAIPPWPWNLVERLDKEPDRCAGVGGGVLPLRNGRVSRYNTYYRQLEPNPAQPSLVTANCAYRASVLNEVGGFPKYVHTAGGEELGLGIKVRQRGYTVAFEPSAAVYHDYRESPLTFLKTYYAYGRGIGMVFGDDLWPMSAKTILRTLFLSGRRNLREGVPFMDAVFFYPVMRAIARICLSLGRRRSRSERRVHEEGRCPLCTSVSSGESFSG